MNVSRAERISDKCADLAVVHLEWLKRRRMPNVLKFVLFFVFGIVGAPWMILCLLVGIPFVLWDSIIND